MTIRKLTLAAFGMAAALSAQPNRQTPAGVIENQHVDFPAGGVLHLVRSSGEVSIEGWDGPGMEITTSRVPPPDNQSPAPVHVTVERHGSQVVVATTESRSSGVWLMYDIKIPRNAGVIIDRQNGEVHLAALTGDIQAATRQGQITFLAPPGAQYAIDARSKWGDVYSDFPGRDRRRFWVTGHRFVPQGGGGSKLYLRADYGDIIIQKAASK